jgi:hypothetical protein
MRRTAGFSNPKSPTPNPQLPADTLKEKCALLSYSASQ